MPDEAKKKFEERIGAYRAEVQRLTTDSAKKGLSAISCG
jgi:uncharacterized small protein (DUF1192 family)